MQLGGGSNNVGSSEINDGSIVNDDISPTAAIDPAKIASLGYVKLGTKTLGADAATLTTDAFTAKKHLRLLISVVGSADAILYLQFNGDTGTNYDGARSSLQAAATQYAGATQYYCENLSGTAKRYLVVDILNIATLNKGIHSVSSHDNDHGECTGEWNNATDQITTVKLLLSAAGDLTAGTTIDVYGMD